MSEPWRSMGVSTISSKKERRFCYTWASLTATRSCPLCHCCVIFTWVLTGDPLCPLHLLLVAVVLTWCCGLKSGSHLSSLSLWGQGTEMNNASSSVCFPLTESNNDLCYWCPSLCSVDGVAGPPRGVPSPPAAFPFSFATVLTPLFCQEFSEIKVLLRLKGQGLLLRLLLLLVSPPRCENSAPWLLPGVRTWVPLVEEGAGGGGNHLQVIEIKR